jgi:4-hydroxybenzoate polyprenyltransferase
MSTATASIRPVSRLRTYASFVRFEHTLFTLPLILAGVFSVAGPAMSAGRWLLVALAAVGARTTAMSLNRLIDRRLDALNPRTRVRELPSGKMRLAEAWSLLAVALAAYLAACWALDPAGFFYLRLAAIPVAIFTLYPYTKRFTPFCHFGVGAGMCLAPLAGYVAAHPDLTWPWTALWLTAFTFFWGSGFDIIYSTLDEESDRANGIHSMVTWLGRRRALAVSAFLHVVAFASLALAGLGAIGSATGPSPVWFAAAGHLTYSGMILMAAMLAVAGVLLFLEQRWAENVNLTFFKVNVWVSLFALLMILASHYRGTPWRAI